MPAEALRPPRTQHSPGPSDPYGGGGPDDSGLCSVSSGHYGEQLPVAGMTVGAIRRRFRDRFDIDPQATAIVDGNEVGDDTILRAGQQLMFSRKAGEKG
jgi:hypothetical protein